MLKIEFNCNVESANCLLDILNCGMRSVCAYCEYKRDSECPFDYIRKAKENIVEFIDSCNKKEC